MNAVTAPQCCTNAIVDWNGIDHVLLDMDGTILDLAFDNYFWSELVPQRYAQLHGLSVEAAIAALAPRFESARGQLNWYCLDYWSELTGLDIAGLKREIRARIAPLPGSAEFIQAVRDSGRQLWLVTNAHRHSWQLKMAQTGFEPHFHRILSSHDFGAPKEDPRFWPALRAQHLFDPARALFVDDSLAVLREALNHGFAHVVAIRQPDSQRPRREMPDFTAVDRLVELLPIA
ncbi:MAG: nucleotidase [Nevskia sp.]|nr:nucleotidase [Nevskia sp.]